MNLNEDVLRGSRRVVVIGVHGWFPGTVMRTVIGEVSQTFLTIPYGVRQLKCGMQPTGTSTKLVNMMAEALKAFENGHRYPV
ncbi:hypothetical protein JOM56_015376 [Amanita muscaria]